MTKSQFPEDLVTFTEEILKEKLHFLCSADHQVFILKEILHPNVRSSIDSLPYSSEGYERTKNILK